MKHALDDHKTLALIAFKHGLWIDGTADDGTYQGDGVNAPWVIYDIKKQKNVSKPFDSAVEARQELVKIISDL